MCFYEFSKDLKLTNAADMYVVQRENKRLLTGEIQTLRSFRTRLVHIKRKCRFSYTVKKTSYIYI
jgi:hypothetical protein